jgi:NAD+ synthase (glutamine-hydrolysing)
LNFPLKNYFENTAKFIEDIEKTYRNLNLFFFKRIQAPPILTVSKRAFGYDMREAVLDDYLVDDYYKLKDEAILKQL